MTALWREGREIARVERADTRTKRRRGLLGRASIDGVFMLVPCRAVHTLGMRMPIDVAHVSRRNRVLRVKTLRPGRIDRPVLRAHAVLEAAPGAFAAWGLRVGDVVEIR